MSGARIEDRIEQFVGRLDDEAKRLRATGQKTVDAVLTDSLSALNAKELDQLAKLLDRALGDNPDGV